MVSKYDFHILFLIWRPDIMTNKRRISNNIIAFFCRQYIIPIHTESVAADNVFIALQWKWSDPLAHHFGSL